MTLEKEIPYCTIFLVAAALICHSLVLTGNLATSKAMAEMGKSTAGWSNVGLGLANSLNVELDELLTNTTEQLTKTISTVAAVQGMVDGIVSASGGAADAALVQAHSKHRVGSLLQIKQQAPEGAEAEEAVMKLINDCYITPVVSSPDDVMTLAMDNDHEDTMFKCLRDHEFPGVDVDDNENKDKTAGEMIIVYTQAMATYVADDPEALAKFKEDLKKVTNVMIEKFMAFIIEKLDEFLVNIKPALIQIGKWLISFGEKIQGVIEAFSQTLDLVQKLFDSLMASSSSEAGKGIDQMIYDTITLFDTQKTGKITAEDLKSVAVMYGVSSLAGDKADGLFKAYDADKSGDIDENEYVLMVQDTSVPGLMPVVLRAYSKKLSGIAGNVAAARMRDEVADTVAQYLTLVSSKNYTKVQWVSERLTNASLPMAFTADLMKQLVVQQSNPDKVTTIDVGQIIVAEMYRQNKPYLQETVELMSTPKFWAEEGFDPDLQPSVIEQVTKWMSGADCVLIEKQKGCQEAGCIWQTIAGTDDELCMVDAAEGSEASLLELSQEQQSAVQMRQMIPKLAREGVKRRQALFWRERRREHAEKHAQLFQSVSAKAIRHNLLGGVGLSAGASGKDPAMEMAVNSGVPAVPETLEFAKFLSWNASDTAQRFQKQTFDFTGESSSSLDSFADSIKAMIGKIQGFLKLMESYSTPDGIQRLEDMVHDFAVKGTQDVTKILDTQIDKFDLVTGFHEDTSGLSLISEAEATGLSDIFVQLSGTLNTLMTALPSVLSNLKDARKQVSTASSGLKSLFEVFKEKGPPIFEQVSALYSTIWVAYFILFAILTTSILFYGFWASGWFGSHADIPADAHYEAPTGMVAKLGTCYSSCCSCVRGCHDTALCFWSFILLFQVFVLLIFLVSIVLTLLAGVKAFMHAGCAQIYFMNDEKVCQGVMNMVSKFLETFWADAAGKLEDACTNETLLTCSLIGKKLQTASMHTILGSLLAAVFSFQLIIDSAILHERARWRKIFDEKET